MTYLLSPASTWKEFGNLDIVINTPYYLVENSIEGFEYKNPGYELHLTGLPEGELEFTLCSEKKIISNRNNFTIIPYIIGGMVIIEIALILIIKNRKAKKSKG